METELRIETPAGEVSFFYRKDSIGDNGVIDQIFNNGDYSFINWAQGRALMNYFKEVCRTHTPLVIDAGANIGASTLYFSIILPNSFIFAIEPEVNNFLLLEKNTRSIKNKKIYQGAIASRGGKALLVDPGQSDWGFRTRTTDIVQTDDARVVDTISPTMILQLPEIREMKPLIVKIDIEGGEAELFDQSTEWLEKFPMLIIELHDWMLPFSGSSKAFLKTIAEHEFDFLYRGENLFLFNRNILKPYLRE